MAALNLKAAYSSYSQLTAFSEGLFGPNYQTNPTKSPNHFRIPLPSSNRKQFCLSRQSPSLRSDLKPLARRSTVHASAVGTGSFEEVLPPALDSTSEPPTVFDGTSRLYISYTCPFAQRAWITRNCKGLQEKIKLVPIDLGNRPTWYKEKVYPTNKVPSLEHNNEVRGESLELIKYIDSHFEGPSLSPDDPAKKAFADELFSYADTFSKSVRSSFKEDVDNDEAGAAFLHIEEALSKFDEGPFFLGEFSLVDIAYAPLIERYKPFLLDVKEYDITAGRPKLALWIKEMDKNEGYKQTKRDPKEHVEIYKRRLLAQVKVEVRH